MTVSGGLREHLRPVNAVLSALDQYEFGYPTPLADVGYRLGGIEVPVRTEGGKSIIDVVAATEDRSRILAIECKSGATVKGKQANRLGELEWEELVRAADLALPELPIEREVHVLYAVLVDHADDIVGRLEDKAHDEFGVLAVDTRSLDLQGSSSDPRLNELDWPMVGSAPYQRALPLDHHCERDDFFDPVVGELVAAVREARGKPAEDTQVPIKELLKNVVPAFDYVVERTVRRGIENSVNDAIEAVIDAAPDVFGRSTRSGEPTVAILSTPEESELQGRTQSYQRIVRSMQEVVEGTETQSSLFSGIEDDE